MHDRFSHNRVMQERLVHDHYMLAAEAGAEAASGIAGDALGAGAIADGSDAIEDDDGVAVVSAGAVEGLGPQPASAARLSSETATLAAARLEMEGVMSMSSKWKSCCNGGKAYARFRRAS